MSDRVEFVDFPSVMMVETVYDIGYEPQEREKPKDLFDLQHEPEMYYPDYFVKDKYYKCQQSVVCKICQCDFQSIQTLWSHVIGSKHAKQKANYKKKILGISNEQDSKPPRKKIKLKTENPRLRRPDVRLRDLLEAEDILCLGLEYIEEYVDPSRPHESPIYICTQPGCNNAWAEAKAMKFHLCGSTLKHSRIFLQIHSSLDTFLLNKTDLMKESRKYAEDHNLLEKDFSRIVTIKDGKKLLQLKNQRNDFSEPKKKAGNSNFEPIGEKFKLSKDKETEDDKFSKAREECRNVDELISSLLQLQTRIENNLKKIKDGDQSLLEIQSLFELTGIALQQYSNSASYIQTSHISKYVGDMVNDVVSRKLVLEFHSLPLYEKSILSRLEKELRAIQNNVISLTETANEKDVQILNEKLSSLREKILNFEPLDPENIEGKIKLLRKCDECQNDCNSQPRLISDILQQMQMEMDNTKATELGDVREKAIELFRQKLCADVKNILRPSYENPQHPEDTLFSTKEEYMAQVNHISKKVIDAEINAFEKEGNEKQWPNFKYTLRTHENVEKYVTQHCQQVMKKKRLQ